MKSNIFFYILVNLIFNLVLKSNQEPYRVFTDEKQRTIEARFKGFKGDQIEIVRRDGRTFRVYPSRFSYPDQKYISGLREKINPKTNRLWNKNDFKSLLVRNKWTCEIKSGEYKHIIEFALEKIDLDKDDIPDGRKFAHHTSFINKKRQSSFGWWKVNREGVIETSLGTWEYDKQNGKLKGHCKSCYSSCCATLSPYVRQIEQR